MTLEELENALNWGLHDADLVRLEVDWQARRLTLDARLQMDRHQESSQLARIALDGLRYFSVTPPRCEERDEETLPWIDAGQGFAREEARATHPSVPPGHFIHWLFFRETCQEVQICAREASLTWLEPAPVSKDGGHRALFPGDEIPDPE